MSYYRIIDRRKKTLSDLPTMLVTFTVCFLCLGLACYHSVGFPLAVVDAVFPVYGILCRLLNNCFAVYAIGLLLTILVAYIIQRINDIENLIRERTRLVFMLFILFTSTNMGLLPFKEISIVLLCLVFMLYELIGAYQMPEATGRLFNAGVLVGFAGLFMPQTLWYVPLLWLGMYQFRSLNLRSFLASLAGVMIIYWFLLAWCVWKHDFYLFASFYSSFVDFDFFTVFLLVRYEWIGSIGIVLLLFISFFYIKMDAFSNRVRVRLMLSFLFNMSVWSLLLVCFYGGDADSFLALLYLPVSVLIAYFLENIRHRFQFLLYYFMLVLCASSFILRLWNF